MGCERVRLPVTSCLLQAASSFVKKLGHMAASSFINELGLMAASSFINKLGLMAASSFIINKLGLMAAVGKFITGAQQSGDQ